MKDKDFPRDRAFVRRILVLAVVLAIGVALVIQARKSASIEQSSEPTTAATEGGAASESSVPPSGDEPGSAGRPGGVAAFGTTNVAPSSSVAGDSREFDIAVNPYAAGLREPGRSKRAWAASFFEQHREARIGDPIQFELTEGMQAAGSIQIVQVDNLGLKSLSGRLDSPEAGTFFFLRQSGEGRAGSAVGVIEFRGSRTAYRIEPTGQGGAPELWLRRLDEVLCLNMPAATGAVLEEALEAPPLRPDLVPEYVPGYNSNVVSLQSLPGARGVVLLDFFGGYTASWGGVHYSAPDIGNAEIRNIWKRVAEDYMPLNMNVTTDRKVYEAAPEASRQRCVFAPDAPTGAGVAYFGSWNWDGDTVCWSRYISGKGAAEVASHEVGHTVGLSHQTQDFPDETHVEYFGGHDGPGNTGWAPIMGVGYYQPVTTWSKGEYEQAGQLEDELAVMVTYNEVDYRGDDTGATLLTSRYLEAYADHTVSGEGVIETTGDSDAYQFTTTGGSVSLNANVVGDWANLALLAEIQDAAGMTVASNDPQNTLSTGISASLAPGTYTLRVTGSGRNNPLTDGFSSYASLGYYSVTGNVAGIRVPSRFSVNERSPNGTVVGTVTHPYLGSHSLDYAITGGNAGSAFALDDDGVLTVANSAALLYANLAYDTQQRVQYELFVDIQDLTDPLQTETSRRVVVAVLDVPEPDAELIHRWSFNNGLDSLGGAHATLVGAASYAGGKLQIPGGAARANCASVNLNNTLASHASLTIEGWFTLNALQNWSKVWMFGRPNGGVEPALAYVDFTPRAGAAGNVPSMSLNTGVRSYESNTRSVDNPAPLATGVEYHVACVYDAVSSLMSLYLDGVRVDCVSMSEANLTQLAATEAFFGAALHYPDPNLNGAINEIRIYDGAVTPLQVAINQAAGPDAVVNDPGTLLAVRLVVPQSNMVSLATQAVKVYADYAAVTNVDVTTSGATLSAANARIVTVDSPDSISAIVPGTTILTASFGGLTDQQVLNVTGLPTVLAHRWSFNNGVDSVGGASATLIGSASYSAGRLILPGGGPQSNCASVDISATLKSTVDLTIESWFTLDTLQDWAKVWMFGSEASESGEPWLAYVGFTPRAGSDGNVPSSSFNPANGNEVNTRSGSNPAVLTTGTEYHAVTTYDARSNLISLYLNGMLVDSAPLGDGDITQLGNDPNEGYFGAAVNFPDDCLNGSLDEMRVWKGVLSPSHVAFNTTVGPDLVSSDPGALTDVRFEVATHTLVHGTSEPGAVFADFANYPNLNVTGSGVAYASSHPGIVSVSPGGVLTAVGAGTATVTATYGGLNDAVVITVIGGAGSVLLHRWSFNDGTDSVGGADASLVGAAYYAGGRLRIPGGPARAHCATVNIADTLATNASLTVEGWFSMNTLQNWSKVWMFGAPNGGVEPGLSYVDFTPRRGDGTLVPSINLNTAFENEVNTAGGTDPAVMTAGPEYHVAAVYDPSADLMLLYINGALADSASMNGADITELQATEAWFGAAVYWGDPNLNGWINEIRIWDGPLSASDLATHYLLGPNELPQPTLTVIDLGGGDIELSWPESFAGFTLQSSPGLAPTPTWSPVAAIPVLSNDVLKVNLSPTSPASFFRLAQ